MKQKLKSSLRGETGECACATAAGPAALAILAVLVLLIVPGCEIERRKSDAELGLNSTQAVGRQIYDRQCGGCHEAYSSRALKGPSLQGLFQHPYMKNGMPANNERVREIIVYGRAKMPSFGRALNQQQVDELMEYLHTL